MMPTSEITVRGILLAALSSCAAAATSPQLDIDAIASAGPPPTPSIATNVAFQSVTYDAQAVESSAAAQQIAAAAPQKIKRAACDPQMLGKGPVPSPDTDQAFVSYAPFASAASAAPTPSGYVNTFLNLQAENNALGYMGYTLLDTYDVPGCSAKCDAINGCSAFNVAFERSPSLDPSPDGGACPQPNTTTLIKCVFWGGPVTAANAVNNGQYRNDYHVVIAGSNGYVNQTVDYCAGYDAPDYLGGQAIVAPSDCNNRSTYIGNQYWNDGKPFDTRRCSAACSAQTSANPSIPCRYFNTFIISKDGQSYGQYCAMYSQKWDPSYASVNSVAYNGSTYSVSYSYSFTNSTNSGLPCAQIPETPCRKNQPAGFCLVYPFCNFGQGCFCGSDVDGNSACFQSVTCSSATTCIANAGCPDGYICLNKNNCCGHSVCVPNSICANGLSPRNIFSKRQSDGSSSDELTTVHVPGSNSTDSSNSTVYSNSSSSDDGSSSSTTSSMADLSAAQTSTATSSDSDAQATDASSS